MSEAASTRRQPGSLADVDWNHYDFLDFGCSNGGSLSFGQRRFGGRRGIGIDRNADKVAQTRAAGFEAVVADALRLEVAPPVRFVLMMDFLEHLPDLDHVERALHAAASSATDFLFIRHPSFEGQAELTSRGLQQYWWSWTGHTAQARVSDYCTMLDRLGLRNWFIRYRHRIDESSDPSVVPEGFHDTHAYDPAIHGDKPLVVFREPVWRAQDIFVPLRAFGTDEWRSITEAG